MQARYQYGTLTLRKREKGPSVWQWRWCENGRRKSVIVGTVQRLPSRAAALRAIEVFRLKINSEVPQAQTHSTTVNALIDRYAAEEMPKRCRYSTQESYLTSLNDYIRPRWGDTPLQNVRAMAVEDWLGSLGKKSEPGEQLSPRSKTHIRNLLHLLFQCAMRWELVDRNPITMVRQSGGRQKIPRILSPEEFLNLLIELKEPYKTMVLVAGGLGLRASEVVGLQWGDFNWEALTVMISRSVVHGRLGETKTEALRKPMPLDQNLKVALLEFWERSSYRSAADFVFAGNKGKPRWQETILADHIKPAAMRAGVGKVGWHTFRHTYATLLHGLGTPLAVQKELLRHADIQTTMNIYTQAVSGMKRRAAHRVVRLLLHGRKKKGAVCGGPAE